MASLPQTPSSLSGRVTVKDLLPSFTTNLIPGLFSLKGGTSLTADFRAYVWYNLSLMFQFSRDAEGDKEKDSPRMEFRGITFHPSGRSIPLATGLQVLAPCL